MKKFISKNASWMLDIIMIIVLIIIGIICKVNFTGGEPSYVLKTGMIGVLLGCIIVISAILFVSTLDIISLVKKAIKRKREI